MVGRGGNVNSRVLCKLRGLFMYICMYIIVDTLSNQMNNTILVDLFCKVKSLPNLRLDNPIKHQTGL